MARPKKSDNSANEKNEARGVQSIEVGAKLLVALKDEAQPLKLKDLAALTGFVPARAHAYLTSYKEIGLVEQDPESGRYMLGKFAIDLGMTRMRTTDPMQLAQEAVIALSRKTSLNVALVVWGTYGPTVIQVHESGGQINMNTRPGTVYSMSGTASGRIFSSFLPEEVVKEAIKREKQEGNSSGRVGTECFISKKEIEAIRHAGYATVETPPVPGVSAYAAPVFDHIGQLFLTITIIGHDYYVEERAETEFIPALLEATQKLSSELGYTKLF